jgi:hypothetical protein
MNFQQSLVARTDTTQPQIDRKLQAGAEDRAAGDGDREDLGAVEHDGEGEPTGDLFLRGALSADHLPNLLWTSVVVAGSATVNELHLLSVPQDQARTTARPHGHPRSHTHLVADSVDWAVCPVVGSVDRMHGEQPRSAGRRGRSESDLDALSEAD